MRKLIIIALFATACLGSLWAASPKIAVLDLDPKAGFTKDEAQQVTDIVRTGFVNTGKFVVLERSQLTQVLSEQEFSSSMLAENTDSAIRVGKMVVADYVVVGTVGRLVGKISINVRLINVSTGMVDAAQSVLSTDESLFNDIMALCPALAKAVASPSVVNATPQAQPAPTPDVQPAPVETAAPAPAPEGMDLSNEIGLAGGVVGTYGYMDFGLTARYTRMIFPWLGIDAAVGLSIPRFQYSSIGLGPLFRFGFLGVYYRVEYSPANALNLGLIYDLGIDVKLGRFSVFIEGASPYPFIALTFLAIEGGVALHF